MVVKDELAKLGLHYSSVELGEANVLENISSMQHDQFRAALLKTGLELMDDKKSMLIEKIKNVIVELVHYTEKPLAINFSEFLSGRLHHDYTYLANTFSEVHRIGRCGGRACEQTRMPTFPLHARFLREPRPRAAMARPRNPSTCLQSSLRVKRKSSGASRASVCESCGPLKVRQRNS